ncbi:hypothetical protein [Dysgonomonas sp. 521]|nr:hypothetical protein [Dysgonomonas sp. 521]
MPLLLKTFYYPARNHRLLALLLAEAPKVSKKALRPASPYAC